MTDEPARMRWEGQPLVEREAFRLTTLAEFGLVSRLLAGLGHSDALDAIQIAAGRVRERLRGGVFRS